MNQQNLFHISIPHVSNFHINIILSSMASSPLLFVQLEFYNRLSLCFSLPCKPRTFPVQFFFLEIYYVENTGRSIPQYVIFST